MAIARTPMSLTHGNEQNGNASPSQSTDADKWQTLGRGSVDSINHSFLIQYADCNLRQPQPSHPGCWLQPEATSLQRYSTPPPVLPDAVANMFSEFPDCCWCIFITVRGPPHSICAVRISVTSSLISSPVRSIPKLWSSQPFLLQKHTWVTLSLLYHSVHKCVVGTCLWDVKIPSLGCTTIKLCLRRSGTFPFLSCSFVKGFVSTNVPYWAMHHY